MSYLCGKLPCTHYIGEWVNPELVSMLWSRENCMSLSGIKTWFHCHWTSSL